MRIDDAHNNVKVFLLLVYKKKEKREREREREREKGEKKRAVALSTLTFRKPISMRQSRRVSPSLRIPR